MMPTLDFTLGDNLADIRAFLNRIGPIADGSAETCNIDLSQCRFIGPDATAMLAAIYLDAEHRGITPNFILPGGPSQLVSYCDFVGLSHLVDPTKPIGSPRHPSNETVAITRVSDAPHTSHLPVLDLIKRHRTFSDDFAARLGACVGEVIQNVVDHAKSPIGGVLVARYFSARQEVRVAIADRGVGIHTTLSAQHPNIRSAVDALQTVIKGEVSAQTHPHNRGLGISNLAMFLTGADGTAVIVSEGGLAELRNRKKQPWRYQSTTVQFHGTAIFFTLPIK